MKAARQASLQVAATPATAQAQVKPQARASTTPAGHPRADRSRDARPSGPLRPANHVLAGPLPRPRLSEAKPGGIPVPNALRPRLVPVIGARAVDAARLHTNDEAHARASRHQARAVAEGEHIWFAAGQYRPGTRDGDALIAHELAHVAQAQRGELRGPAFKALSGQPQGPLETMADQAADQVTAGADLDEQQKQRRKAAQQAAAAPTLALAPLRPSGDAALDAGRKPAVAPAADPATVQPDNAAAVTADAAGATTDPGPATDAAEAAQAPARAALPKDLPLMPEPALSLSPAEKQRAAGVQSRAGGTAKAVSTAPPAQDNVAAAQAAVQVPQAESDALAAQKIVAELATKEKPSPEIVALCDRIRTLIREKRPADEDAMIDTRPAEVAQAAGASVEGGVQKDVDGAKASYGAIDAQPAGPAPATAPDMAPLPAETPAPALQATAATPDAVPPEQVSLDGDAEKMQAQAHDAGLDKESAQLVQGGPVGEARDAQTEMGELAGKGPAEVLKQQQAALAQSDADMAALQARALATLKAARSGHVSGVQKQGGELKEGEEALRARLSKQAEDVYSKAQSSVQDLLRDVPATAMKKWQTQLPLISNQFNDDLKVIKDRIADRHSGVGGFFVGLKDAVAGLPDWAEEGYDRAEKNFGDSVCTLITEISVYVNGIIKIADGIIAQARNDIADIFGKNLPDGLKDWAAQQEAAFGKKLDTLHQQAEDARTAFNKELIENAGEAVQAARENVQKLREEAGGLWGRFLDAVGRFLDDPLKFIIDGLLSLVGISPAAFWALVAKIEKVISDIVDDPIGFAGKLMDGISQGFSQFFDHIGRHLIEGFLEWLISGMKKDGIPIEVPKELSLRSVVGFILQLLGISWTRIRKLLVEQLGEKAVAVIEKAGGVIQTLATKGLVGIYDDIKKMLEPKAIVDAIVDAAVKYITETLIEKVAARILLLFNPVGAIAAAIEAIYRVLKWIFHNAARLFHLVQAVVDAMADVLVGNLKAVADKVEGALAMLVAPVIDFLADYLGLGGLPGKVAEAVKGLQGWVEGVMRSVITWLVAMGRKVMAALGLGGKEDKDGKKDGKGQADIGETLSFQQGDETHHLYIKVSGSDATVMVASTPMTVSSWLDHLRRRAAKELQGDEQARALKLIDTAADQLRATDANADNAAKAQVSATKPETAEAGAQALPAIEQKVESSEELLRDTLDKLGQMFGGGPMVIKAVAVQSRAVFDPPYTPNFISDVDDTGGGAIYTAKTSDEHRIGKIRDALKEQAFDEKTGTLTLPAIGAGALSGVRTLGGLGSEVGSQTLARQVLFDKGPSEFTLDVGFDFYARGALKGRVLMTPDKRLQDFAAHSQLAEFKNRDLKKDQPRYKPDLQSQTGYPETSAPFRREDYLSYFASQRKEQGLNTAAATSDLTQWLERASGAAGRLSRVGAANAVTYILTRGAAFSEVVIDTESDQVDPVLRETVLNLGIVPFMKEVASNKAPGGIDRKKLETELWPHAPNAVWLANRFRDFNKSAGMHEWIPSSSIPKTIERAATAANWLKGEKWIDLHHDMRADTEDLIGKPQFWVERKVDGKSFWLPQGHDGAIEHDELGAQTRSFSSASPFHVELFDNIESCNGLSDCVAGARKVFEKYIWAGEAPKTPLDRGLLIRGQRVGQVETLRVDQAARYARLMTFFDTLAAKYKD